MGKDLPGRRMEIPHDHAPEPTAGTCMHTGLLTNSLGQVPETSPLEFDLTGVLVGQSARFHPTEGGGQTQLPY